MTRRYYQANNWEELNEVLTDISHRLGQIRPDGSIVYNVIGGYTVSDDAIYNFDSRGSTAHPNDGVILDSYDNAIYIYEGFYKRIAIGNLAPDLSTRNYGIKGWDSSGATGGVLFELSDSQNIIAGWTISSASLAYGTNIILDSTNNAIYLSASTFGNKGIQIEYNAGSPRLYVGDGSSEYLQFDGTYLTWKAANTELDSSGNLTASNVDLTGQITASCGTIGGWTIGSSDLSNSSVSIHSTGAFHIKDAIFGNQGVQIEYNDGTPRLYAGDGSSKFVKWDGSDLSWKGTNSELTTAGVLISSSASLGGWDFSSVSISRSSVTLHSTGALYIKNATYGQEGIQLEYNNGTPRFYAGDGTTASFFFWDGSDVALSAAKFELTTAGIIDATSGTIAGWQITSAWLANSSVYMYATGAFTVKSSTFGDRGIQLQYNDGNPRFHVGDSSYYLQYTSAGAVNVKGSITITGGSGISNLSDAGVLSTQDTVAWSSITDDGGKPSDNADVTSAQFTNTLATIDSQTDKVELGLDSSGSLVTSVLPGSNVGSPSTSGLFLGADYMGYYSTVAASSWAAYINASGEFLFRGNASNYISWDGSTLTIEGAITATVGAIGGWTLGSNTLSNSSTTLHSTGALTIKSSTFGDLGLQFEYNNGAPRMYVGDGGSDFLQYTSSSGVEIGLGTAGVMSLQAGANITLKSSSLNNAYLILESSGASFRMGADYVQNRLVFHPTTTSEGAFYVGWDSSTTYKPFSQIFIAASSLTQIQANATGTYVNSDAYMRVLSGVNNAIVLKAESSGGSSGNLTLNATTSGSTWSVKVESVYEQLNPDGYSGLYRKTWQTDTFTTGSTLTLASTAMYGKLDVFGIIPGAAYHWLSCVLYAGAIQIYHALNWSTSSATTGVMNVFSSGGNYKVQNNVTGTTASLGIRLLYYPS